MMCLIRNVLFQCQELESEKEQIMLSVAPLKTKVARLMQKCREKVSFDLFLKYMYNLNR